MKTFTFIGILLCLSLFSCQKTEKNEAHTIFYGGDIITMVSPEQPAPEALVVTDGKIVFTGSKSEALKMQGDSTKLVNLEGKTLLPGFLDPHSHFNNAPQIVNWVNVSAPPVGNIKTIDDIVNAIKAHVTDKKPAKGEWIIGYGYDGNMLKEGRELTKKDLDPHFPDNPIMLIHVSNHGAVLNSAAFIDVDITAETETPPSGIILREPGGNEPAGLIMETAFIPVFKGMPKPPEAEHLANFKPAQIEYAKWGFTTVHEGATPYKDLQIIKKANEQDLLFLDVIAYPLFTEMDKVVGKETFGAYDKRLKIGGIKVLLDGSPQAKTALKCTPYLTGGPNGEADWRGESTITAEEYAEIMKVCYDNGIQLNTHVNADCAIKMMLDGMDSIGYNSQKDLRWVAIHAQFMHPDYLPRFAKHQIIPSFFSNHTFFFADTHLENFGPEMTHFIDPFKAAIEAGLTPTNHSDYSVTPLDPFFGIWTACVREARSGTIIGENQRITVYQALEAITKNVAYQYHEEDRKGTLEVGKLADLVILDKNPLAIELDAIRNLQVMETLKEGKTVYKR
ncbi:amidohydrolase [Sediminicola luteus]|uniref:Amidohydrolase 3 domain-containing protein n=1 Tax=Sediminicola luteus TaxID=319238 RepID=A0A2A4G4B9_9FLAO|nr:amidohydrolase [Sediminicola luteus]PCE62820.1 hypothetical protein B7P33_16195 [Sediminicola luteus]